MKTPLSICKHARGLLAALVLLNFALFPAAAAPFVYQSPTEFFSSGDFNGDGILDVLVLDRTTGNARVGYQDANNSLTWSSPIPTGVTLPDALAVGHFRGAGTDAVAVVSVELNRIQLAKLDGTTPVATTLTQNGIGPSYLAALSAPAGIAGPFDTLAVGSTANSANYLQTLIEIVAFQADTLASNLDQIAEQAYLSTGNPAVLGVDPVTYAAAMQRGGNSDQFSLFAPSNHFASVLTQPGLSVGTFYAMGTFNNEPLPRLLFFVPGQSNVLIQAVLRTNSTLQLDAPVTVTLPEAIQNVFVLQQNGDDSVILLFGDGAQGLRLPGGTPTLLPKYSSGVGAAGNVFTGMVPLAGGNFALLDGPHGASGGSHAQVIHFTGSGYVQLSSSDLPPITSRLSRANLWMFQVEPFVNSNPNFLASSNTPDWTSAASISGNLTVRIETDGGVGPGLGSPATNDLGAPPTGVGFAIPQQYQDSISLFSYAPPKNPETINLAISPPPGLYGGPITVSVTAISGAPKIYVRHRTNDNYTTQTTFTLTNDATVQYYGTNTATHTRSRLYSANYSFGRSGAPSQVTPLDVAPGTTNPAPPYHTNTIFLADVGTAFYGRRPALTGPPLFLGPSPYLAFANSPFASLSGFSYFYLENFEDGLLNTPGVSPSAGWVVVGPSSSTDSVDEDDGSINGSGAGGHSYYSGGSQNSLTLTFNPAALGGHYPTHAGIVWTDVGSVTSGTIGHGNVVLSAVDRNGFSLGSITGTNLGDGTSVSATAEDRFFGIINSNGISSITITMPNSKDWEVDHLQYGYLPPANVDGTIWTINLDGSGETYVTTGARPRASADGRYLAFLREGLPFDNQGNIWVRDLTTGQETRLFVCNPIPFANTNILVSFDWDLSRTNLIFDYNNRFWRLGLDGSLSQFSLAASANQAAPSVNPIDGRVAFQILYPGPTGLYLAPADISSKQLLLGYPSGARWPAWSPDGSEIAFSDGPVSSSVDSGKNLWVTQLISNNINIYQITGITDNTNGFPHGAQWSPSGTALVSAGTLFNTNGVWIIPLNDDGTDCQGPAILLPTSPGDPVDYVGSVIAAPALPGVVRPGLFITMTADSVVVYWSSAYQGFTLESTMDLTSPAVWTPEPGPYDFDGYLFYHFEPLNSLGSQKFFRLHYSTQ